MTPQLAQTSLDRQPQRSRSLHQQLGIQIRINTIDREHFKCGHAKRVLSRRPQVVGHENQQSWSQLVVGQRITQFHQLGT